MAQILGAGTTQEDKEEVFLQLSGMPRALFDRWKSETNYGTTEGSVEMRIECLLHALRRDRARNPNLSAYTWLTPEKKAEIEAEFHYEDEDT